jgi:hypothetical protein
MFCKSDVIFHWTFSVSIDSRFSTSYNNFFLCLLIHFVNVHNSNCVKLITVLPDACDGGNLYSRRKLVREVKEYIHPVSTSVLCGGVSSASRLGLFR